MAKHTGTHTWHASNCLQEDETDHPFAFVHDIWFARIMSIASGQVHSFPKQSAKAKRHPIGPRLAFSVGDLDGLHVIFVVDWMVPCWRGELNRGCVLGRFEIF